MWLSSESVFGDDKFLMCVFELREDDFVYVLPNKLMADYVRTSVEELTGRKASEMMPADEMRKWVALFKECREKKTTISNEFYAAYDGRDAWYDSNVSYIEGSGNLFFFVAVDITERKLAEEKLRESEGEVPGRFKAMCYTRLAPGVAG